VDFTTIKVPGFEAIRLLEEHRLRYESTGEYPFLIGDAQELDRIKDTAHFNEREPAAIIQSSFDMTIADWIAVRRKDLVDDEFSAEETSGSWPGEVVEKGSISLHRDVLTGTIKPEVYLGLARIEEPWQLPAELKFGGWNDCPEPEVHCAFHREWRGRFSAEIIGVSGDVVECAVANPPRNRPSALELAWEQYWYCPDIVDQGCETVAALAAKLLNSPYWYFWWD
jgi:hypothetical protein